MLQANRMKQIYFFFAYSHFAIRIQLNVSTYKENNCGKFWISIGFIIFRGNSVQKYETIISKKVEKYLQNWELSFSIGIWIHQREKEKGV